MSTQDAAGLPFALSQDQSSFRLLELPEELTILLTSDDPPTLQLKSKDPTLGLKALNRNPSYTAAPFAVLCTPSKTFNLRQIQSSNSIYVVEPSNLAAAADEKDNLRDDDMQTDPLAQAGICAIANCPASLEITNASTNNADDHLKDMLFEWIGDGQDAKMVEPKGWDKETVYGEVPLSQAEINETWRLSLAFESNGRCWRLSLRGLLEAWKGLVLAATATSRDLLAKCPKRDALFEEVSDELSVPIELLDAIGSRIDEDNDAGLGLSVLLGRAILAGAGQSGFDRVEFLKEWKELLPTKWQSHAELDALKGVADMSNPVEISLRAAAAPLTAVKPASTGKRQWHEKFKQTRT